MQILLRGRMEGFLDSVCYWFEEVKFLTLISIPKILFLNTIQPTDQKVGYKSSELG
jgi:hypothetical protein